MAGKIFHRPQTIQLDVQCSIPNVRMTHVQCGDGSGSAKQCIVLSGGLDALHVTTACRGSPNALLDIF